MRNTRIEAGKKKQNKTNKQINTHIYMEEVDASTPLLTDIANTPRRANSFHPLLYLI